MKKLNKKGFTLIEMLVVIAIIAILVAVIVPTVTSATGKAKAATDAANLRSALAEATILSLDQNITTETTYTAEALNVPGSSKYDGGAFSCTVKPEDDKVGLVIEVAYGTNGIDYYAAIAGGTSSK